MLYDIKKVSAIKQFKLIKAKGSISLKPKSTSHFFRERKKTNKLDLTGFNQVISISEKGQIAQVEGLTTFHDLSKETLEYGLLPLVVPELRNITIGGAISGLGVESSSFKNGLVHESVIECDVLTGSGRIITCSKNKNPDLFFTLPNSLGTVGYILKCKIKLRPVKKFVHLEFLRFDKVEEYFKQLKKECGKVDIDFIDGVIFSNNHLVIITGKFIDKLPDKIILNDFKINVYWKFIEDKKNNHAYLTVWDYLWRWDTDVFWKLHDTPLVILENKILRKILGPLILRSDLLNKIGRINSFLHQKIKNEKSLYENILQDPCLDIDDCTNFINWHAKTLSTYPLWICPLKNTKYGKIYPLHNFKGKYLVDIGIYTGKDRPAATPENYYNRLLEKKILELKGMKGLYSLSFFTREEFWGMYDESEYLKIKSKYDPDNIFPNIYSKVAGKTTL